MEKDLKLALISEVREDLRTIEQIQITLVLSYYGFFTLIVSVMLSNNINVFKASLINTIVFTLLFVLGIVLQMIQISYKYWQSHYLKLLKTWISEFKIDDSELPVWLASEYKKMTPWSINLILRISTISLTVISFIVLIFYISRLVIKI
ncbi:hypothetical protein Cpap_3040 [Ruminiclostridium papyrosolvens DSM 2782]|uniref:Uncharacterized protein n=1 Tax=Ruminiclostridium papyrosolvens DSM 2782 TaxID=588581 RepID=F1TAS4_9FIRM|nr:hypothetical protein [Ruminiclostridium papyrosolvens]EGD48617.1 hypothetical protein Cpap_3040 [Ruminiclostridium papyrosolvens DSM 2782]WES32627.1 hypothetical protein P0092_12755 [Ruminiclostridium papyrosolvens DSM 2782]